ncbi:NAD(P)-dependent oxidoreductase [Pseudonocardia sp. GCM10023141]|uniref:NAD(P)-dependent oxidoreductase n=1 Tax=Pseudonocardia sp. GCM10023141 TaxID=3252653 RepID=UPI003619078D
MTAPTLGWIGTGRMGTALAGRLIADHDLRVWNRTAARTTRLTEQGAKAVGRVVDLADRDVVFTCVSSDTDLIEVLLDEDGLLHERKGPAPRLLVDCSTVSGATSARIREVLRERGVGYLAAPVSGNPAVVSAGNASLVVSGPDAAFRTAEPLLRELAANVVHVGDAEQARVIKLCHNLYLGMMVQALVEVTTVAEKSGTDAAVFLEFLGGTGLGSDWVRLRATALAEHDWTPTFPVSGLAKDLDLGLSAAREMGVPMPVGATVQQIVRSAVSGGLADKDLLALYELQAAAAGLR